MLSLTIYYTKNMVAGMPGRAHCAEIRNNSSFVAPAAANSLHHLDAQCA